MNFIKKIFGIKEPEKTNEDKEELTEIKESDFIDNSEPNENSRVHGCFFQTG